MTQDEINWAARESGLWLYGLGKDNTNFNFLIAKFAALIAAAEREFCALAVEQAGVNGMGTLAAAAIIRARGEK